MDDRADDELDEELEETFPASDPPGRTVETGIAGPAPEAEDETTPDNEQQ